MSHTETRRRTLELDLGSVRKANDGARIVDASVSSDAPVRQWDGVNQVLDHSAKAIDLTRASKGLALLLHHDASKIIGIAENFRSDGHKLRASLRFGNSADAQTAWSDVEAGILRHVSVGFTVDAERQDKADTVRATKWTPVEVSLVAVPADTTVGIGRSLQPPKGRTMSETETIDPATERDRIMSILAVSKRHHVEDLADGAIREGVTVEQFRKKVLETLATRQRPLSGYEPDGGVFGHLSERDRADASQFSLIRAITAHLTHDWSAAGREREASQELHRRAKGHIAHSGMLIPSSVMITGKRATQTTAVASGIVGTEHMPDLYIDALQPATRVLELGATKLPGLVQNVDIPRATGVVSGYWVGENSAITESSASFDQVALSPKQCSGRVSFTKKLLIQSLPAIDLLMRNDLNRQIGQAIDLAAIVGTGSSNQPKGILNISGIGSVAGGTNGAAPVWDNVVGLESSIAAANADIGVMGYLTNSAVRGKLKRTQQFSSSSNGVPIWTDAGTVNGYKAAVSNHVPSNLTKGTSSGVCSAIIFGNWADMLIGEWGAIDLIVDEYSDAANGNVRIYAHAFVDIQVRHPESFASMQDALTT